MTDEQTNAIEEAARIIREVAGHYQAIGTAAPKMFRLADILDGQVHEEDSKLHPENKQTEKEEGDDGNTL